MLHKIPGGLSRLIKSQQCIHDSYIIAKELIENSLDAGSSRISVVITDTSISVEDNGCGVEDLDLLCRPGFTSKEDTSYRVLGISHSKSEFTHGFRGQALSAISEMCDIEIVSRTAQNELGTYRNYTTGMTEQRPREVGTTVKVRNVFKNCPIRQKSNRKTIRKSLAKIINLIRAYLYVYSVYFELVFNNCTLISECGSDSTTSAAISKHGSVYLNIKDEKFEFLLFPFDKSNTQVILVEKRVCKFERISQLVSNAFSMYFSYPPTYILVLKDECDVNISVDKTEIILKNSKYVENKIKSELDRYFALRHYIHESNHLGKHSSPKEGSGFGEHTNADTSQTNSGLSECMALDEDKSFETSSQACNETNILAESNALEGSKAPDDIFAVDNLNSESISKPMLAFAQNKHGCIGNDPKALQGSYTNANSTSGLTNRSGDLNIKRSKSELESLVRCGVHDTHANGIPIDTANGPSAFNKIVCSDIDGMSPRKAQDSTARSVYNFIKEESLGHSRVVFDKKDFKKMHIIGQFNQGFILCTLKKDASTFLIAVDQHAADEICNFEGLKRSFKLKKQKLLAPIPLELSSIQRLLVEEHRQTLEDNGFVVSENFLLTFPVYQGVFFSVEDFYSALDSISKGTLVSEKFKCIMASKACRSSIMIGTSLSVKEMQRILDDLSVLDLPWNCPHGRPTFKILCEMEKH